MNKVKPIFLILFSFFIFPLITQAASFYIDTNVEFINVGDEIILDIGIENNDDIEITAFEGRLNFDFEKVKFLEIDDSNSIIDYWLIEPGLEQDNTLLFNGVLKQQNGLLFSVKLEAINSGIFSVGVSTGNAIIKQGDVYNLEDMFSDNVFVSISEKDRGSSVSGLISSTHPNEEIWYSDSLVRFEWQLPGTVEKVKVLLDENLFSWPSVEYDSPITSKEIELEDGIWYFHMRYKDENGWSEVETRKVMIDSQKPKNFSFNLDNLKTLIFTAEDDGSGIQGFEIYIPSENYTFFTNSEESQLPFLKPGTYSVIVRALDNAGNYTESISSVVIPYLKSPVISKFYLDDDRVGVVGESYPNSKNIISIEGSEIYNGLALIADNGKFAFEKDDINPGIYKIFITAVGDDTMSQKKLIGYMSITDEEDFVVDTANLKVLLSILIIVLMVIIVYYIVQKEQKPIKRKRGRPKKNNKNKK